MQLYNQILKMLDGKKVAALIRDRFIFYATSVYHDDFDDFLSLSLSSASRPSESVGGVGGGGGGGGGAPGVMGSVGGVSGITEGEGAQGLIEYPYIGVVSPFGVDGVQRPSRIPVHLVKTENLLFKTLKRVVGGGENGARKIGNVVNYNGEMYRNFRSENFIPSEYC